MADIIITEEMIIEQKLARSINRWIQDNKENMYQCSIQLTREAEIALVIRNGMAEAKKFIEENKHRLPYTYKRP
jgi:hypothetical protein